MAQAKVTTLLTTKDRMSSVLSRGMRTIRSFANNAARSLKRATIAAAALSTGAAYIGYNFVKAASDFEETRSKFAAVFKSLTPQAEQFAQAISSELGRSRADVMAFMATLQDTFVPLGFARDAGMEFSKTLVRLAVDLASFNNQAEPDVIRDLQSAIVGNHETMRKYGVIINQVALDQELLNMGVAKGVKGATEAQKAQARLNIIVNGTTDAQGDALRTAGSFANQLKRLNAEYLELKITLGEQLMPVARAFVKWLTDVVGRFREGRDAAGKMVTGLDEVKEAADETKEGLAGIGATIKDDVIPPLWDLLKNGIYVFSLLEGQVTRFRQTVEFAFLSIVDKIQGLTDLSGPAQAALSAIMPGPMLLSKALTAGFDREGVKAEMNRLGAELGNELFDGFADRAEDRIGKIEEMFGGLGDALEEELPDTDTPGAKPGAEKPPPPGPTTIQERTEKILRESLDALTKVRDDLELWGTPEADMRRIMLDAIDKWLAGYKALLPADAMAKIRHALEANLGLAKEEKAKREKAETESVKQNEQQRTAIEGANEMYNRIATAAMNRESKSDRLRERIAMATEEIAQNTEDDEAIIEVVGPDGMAPDIDVSVRAPDVDVPPVNVNVNVEPPAKARAAQEARHARWRTRVMTSETQAEIDAAKKKSKYAAEETQAEIYFQKQRTAAMHEAVLAASAARDAEKERVRQIMAADIEVKPGGETEAAAQLFRIAKGLPAMRDVQTTIAEAVAGRTGVLADPATGEIVSATTAAAQATRGVGDKVADGNNLLRSIYSVLADVKELIPTLGTLGA